MAHIPFLSHYLERKNIEYQNQLLARQVEEVQNIYLTMRGWRHDYHNHLQSMKAYVEMGQYDKLQEYLGLLENDLDQVNQLCDSGNVNLDAILNSKISLAEKNGIRVDYKAACPANLTVSDIDLCALIGNLIDNAVEACEGLADPYIRLYIGYTNKNLLMLKVCSRMLLVLVSMIWKTISIFSIIQQEMEVRNMYWSVPVIMILLICMHKVAGMVFWLTGRLVMGL